MSRRFCGALAAVVTLLGLFTASHASSANTPVFERTAVVHLASGESTTVTIRAFRGYGLCSTFVYMTPVPSSESFFLLTDGDAVGAYPFTSSSTQKDSVHACVSNPHFESITVAAVSGCARNSRIILTATWDAYSDVGRRTLGGNCSDNSVALTGCTGAWLRPPRGSAVPPSFEGCSCNLAPAYRAAPGGDLLRGCVQEGTSVSLIGDAFLQGVWEYLVETLGAPNPKPIIFGKRRLLNDAYSEAIVSAAGGTPGGRSIRVSYHPTLPAPRPVSPYYVGGPIKGTKSFFLLSPATSAAFTSADYSAIVRNHTQTLLNGGVPTKSIFLVLKPFPLSLTAECGDDDQKAVQLANRVLAEAAAQGKFNLLDGFSPSIIPTLGSALASTAWDGAAIPPTSIPPAVALAMAERVCAISPSTATVTSTVAAPSALPRIFEVILSLVIIWGFRRHPQFEDMAASKPWAPKVFYVSLVALTALLCRFCERVLVGVPKRWDLGEMASVVITAIIGGTYSIEVATKDEFLSRAQSEEWKGWMQIIFILYHYYNAAEVYNLVRLLIASYVFLTGYGNAVFCTKAKSFSIERMFQMMFRINFFVIFLCVLVGNEYMLYYICPMHTFWFMVTYVTFWIKSSWNQNLKLTLFKIGCLFGVIIVVWEFLPCEYVFLPLYPILQYKGSMYEWCFRSGLDRYATPTGMVLGIVMNHPDLADWRLRMTQNKSVVSGLAAVSFTTTVMYGVYLFPIDKITYNSIHPYLSMIPVVGYLQLRNSCLFLRKHASTFLGVFGRLSLEVYLLQHHVWLKANAKKLLVIVPDLRINMVITTTQMIALGMVIFASTVALNRLFFQYGGPPHNLPIDKGTGSKHKDGPPASKEGLLPTAAAGAAALPVSTAPLETSTLLGATPAWEPSSGVGGTASVRHGQGSNLA